MTPTPTPSLVITSLYDNAKSESNLFNKTEQRKRKKRLLCLALSSFFVRFQLLAAPIHEVESICLRSERRKDAMPGERFEFWGLHFFAVWPPRVLLA